MKVNLLNSGEPHKPVWNWETLKVDLALDSLMKAMSHGDDTIYKSAETVISSPLTDPDAVRYRQEVLEDCIHNKGLVRNLYKIASAVVMRQDEKDLIYGAAQTASHQFDVSRKRLRLLIDALGELKKFAGDNAAIFSSNGFRRLFADWDENLDAVFFEKAEDLLKQLSFERGMLIGVSLSGIGQSTGQRLLVNHESDSKWSCIGSFAIVPADSSVEDDLLYRQETVKSGCNRSLSGAALDIENYFRSLLQELAFYIGCLNFMELLAERGISFCIPDVTADGERKAETLFELGIAISDQAEIIGSSFDLNGKHCVIITGADLGGKSTFLRSIGQSQLMLLCGMPVVARYYSAPVAAGIYTHFLREEDKAMKNGKLNEELTRMNCIADHLTPGSVVLFDESFCSTNEREGSEIARQIIKALLETGNDVFMVTHLYRLAKTLYDENDPAFAFLIAERLSDGRRTKRIISGLPQPTGYGKDLYNEVFGIQC